MNVYFAEVMQRLPRELAADVHVYTADLTASEHDFTHDLTPDEHQRATKLRIPRIREQFIRARGYLRRLLAEYLGCFSHEVPILLADGGKPYLPTDCNLHFNLSHTDGLAIYAIARHEIGIDVERERPVPDLLALVQRFFSKTEYQRFLEIPADRRQEAFFAAWTCKEAVLKSIGRGVQSLDCCEVSLNEQSLPRLMLLDGQPAHNWQLHAWRPTPTTHAALAYQATT